MSKVRNGRIIMEKNKLFKNRKGDVEVLNSTIIFLILNVLFFAGMFLFVVEKTNSHAVLEEVYAKKIALLIDNAEKGITMNIDVKELYEAAKENNYPAGQVININNEENKVTMKVKEGTGYGHSYRYYTKTEEKILQEADGKTYIKLKI